MCNISFNNLYNDEINYSVLVLVAYVIDIIMYVWKNSLIVLQFDSLFLELKNLKNE